jgi:hypothetical protein
VGRKSYSRDIYIFADATLKKRDKALAKELYGTAHTVGPKELERVCKGAPEVLFVGAGKEGRVELTEDAQRYLSQRSIRCEILPTPKAIEAYNKSTQRRATLIHVTC